MSSSNRLNRRTFCRGMAVAPTMTSVSPVQATKASTATPTPRRATKKRIKDFLPPAVYSPNQSFLRTFEFPETGFLEPAIFWVDALALVFAQEAQAIPYGTAFAEAFRQWTISQYSEDPSYSITELRPAATRTLGEESLAWVFDVEDDTNTFERGILIVRIGSWLQLLLGSTWRQSSIRVLADLSEATEGRWPNSTGTTQVGAQGLHSGGVWEALPQVPDLPEGASVESEGDAHLSR